MNELYHHGIKGQKHGVKHGPPYPLSRQVSTGSRLKTIKKKYNHFKRTKAGRYVRAGAKITAGILLTVASHGILNPVESASLVVAGRTIADRMIDKIGDQIVKNRA